MLTRIICFFALLPCWCTAQEVITNEEGRKVVVQPDGTWRYFHADSTSLAAEPGAYLPPKKEANENQLRIEASKALERQLTLALIKSRVEMVELEIALSGPIAVNNDSAKERLSLVKNKTRQLEIALEAARERTAFLEKIGQMPPETYRRKLKKWEQERPLHSNEAALVLGKETPNVQRPATEFANGILHLPPELPCEPGLVATDPETKERRWETQSTRFFSHTDVAVEREFRKRDFIECTGYMTALVGSRLFLNLEFVVATNKAAQIFGSLSQGDFIEIRLLSGEKIILFNSVSSNGQWVAKLDAYVYNGRYALGFREEKLLRNSEVDKVLVRWSKVQEQYQVYDVDFFMRHFSCLAATLKLEK